jgi:hypothetical protein
MMRNGRVLSSALLIAVAVLGIPAAAAAQTDLFSIHPGPRRVDVSGSGGFLLSTDWSDLVLLGSVSTISGALEQVLVRDLVVEPGPVFDAVVTYWEGRYGFRAHGGFAQSCLAVGGICGGRATQAVDVNAWMYDVGGAVGLTEYRRGALVWPYVFVGVGGVTYDLDRTVEPPLNFIEQRPARGPDGQVIVSRDDPEQLLIAIDELGIETRFALNLGVGSDFRLPLGPASVGLRFEISDNIHRSPINLRVVEVDRFGGDRGATDIGFGYVHNLRAAAGLVVQFGR